MLNIFLLISIMINGNPIFQSQNPWLTFIAHPFTLKHIDLDRNPEIYKVFQFEESLTNELNCSSLTLPHLR